MNTDKIKKFVGKIKNEYTLSKLNSVVVDVFRGCETVLALDISEAIYDDLIALKKADVSCSNIISAVGDNLPLEDSGLRKDSYYILLDVCRSGVFKEYFNKAKKSCKMECDTSLVKSNICSATNEKMIFDCDGNVKIKLKTDGGVPLIMYEGYNTCSHKLFRDWSGMKCEKCGGWIIG